MSVCWEENWWRRIKPSTQKERPREEIPKQYYFSGISAVLDDLISVLLILWDTQYAVCKSPCLD